MKRLSVLIPSIPSRTELLHRLLSILAPQVTPEVEILINMDSGAATIGDKRNSLLRAAEGAWLSFVDDDDRVSFDYVAQLLAGIAQDVDVVSVRGPVYRNGKFEGTTIDKPYQQWRTVVLEGATTFLRGVQHIDCVRREIATSVMFEKKNFGEDFVRTRAIEAKFPNLTSYQVPTDVYIYDWDATKPRFR